MKKFETTYVFLGSLLDLACIVIQISLSVARLLLLEYVGAFYYVLVRGNGRQAITRIGVIFLTSWVAKRSDSSGDAISIA